MEMRNNNKGFSLVELIVVVLIIGVMSGSSILLYNVVQRRNYLKCSDNAVDALELARQSAMVREDGSDVGVVFFYHERNYYAQIVFFGKGSDTEVTFKGLYNLGGGSLSLFTGTTGVATKTKMNRVDRDISNLPEATAATSIKTYVTAGDVILVLFNKNNGSLKFTSKNTVIGSIPTFSYIQVNRIADGTQTGGAYTNIGFSEAGRAYIEHK